MLQGVRRENASAESGQAAIEAAITLPLTVFLVLGTLQLMLLLQARSFVEYAAFSAVRSGVVHHGACEPMLHAAIGALLPTFARTDTAENLARAFAAHRDNRFVPALDRGHDRAIVWLLRESPLANDIRGDEEDVFDDPDVRGTLGTLHRLEARLVYWYPLRIPFANWVMARMFLAQWGLREFRGENPLVPTQVNARWAREGPQFLEPLVGEEMLRRFDRQQYAFPLSASWTMRMMTPARRAHFGSQHCVVPGGAP